MYTGGGELRAESRNGPQPTLVTRWKAEACETPHVVGSKKMTTRPRRPSLTPELNEADAIAEAQAHPDRAGPHRWTPETAREAARLSRESRARRGDRESPSDDDIERGLRQRAVSDPRAAEILLRWLQRPRPPEPTAGADLDAMSNAQLERLYAGLMRIAALPPDELQALVQSVLAENDGG